MCVSQKLSGGLGRNSNNPATALTAAAKKLAAKKEIRLSFSNEAVKKDDGRMDSAELSEYVNGIARGAYEWIVNVACKFLRQLVLDMMEIGEEVQFDQCNDADQTRQQRSDDYEGTIFALRIFSPENNGVLREEAEIPGRQQFVEALCLRVRQITEIGLLVDTLRHAATKDDLEDLLKGSKDSLGEDAKKVFVAVSQQKASIWAFGKGYELNAGVFDRYNGFAREKLAEAVSDRSKELATAHNTIQETRKQEVFAPDKTKVPPEELLFGDPEQVNEKTALLSWKFQGHDNAIKVSRVGNRLYILNAMGKPLEALEAMRKEWDNPFILIEYILSKDGEHLCLGKTAEGKLRYEFSRFINRSSFAMTSWVRTGFGLCVPLSRLLPDDETRAIAPTNGNGKKQPKKAPGELLTDREFLYFGGLGDYDLVVDTGFHYEPRDEEDKPTGKIFSITSKATARLERKGENGKTKLVLKSVSTQELVDLLETGGAVVGHEFFEGTKGSSLPVPLRLAISQTFKRLKLSEVKA